MPIGLKDLSSIWSSPFKVSMEKCTYLGIVVNNKYSLLLKANFTPLISKLQGNIILESTPDLFIQQNKCN